MQFSFDLISDLHIETWNDFNWEDQATSPYCVVAGDVAKDRMTVLKTLAHLSKSYQAVFYIDGNDEHKNYMDDLGGSYRDLARKVTNLKNVVYLQDNVVIINGVAIISTNGWWSFDLDPGLDFEQSAIWYKVRHSLSDATVASVLSMAANDAQYLASSIAKLQKHQDVKSIVIVTHTLPMAGLINHDIELSSSWRFNTMGNPMLQMAIEEDTENKIKIWCFGHYHKSVDRVFAGIRFVNNCRGRGDTPWSQIAYYPKRIVIDN